jgi:O-antigen ligase
MTLLGADTNVLPHVASSDVRPIHKDGSNEMHDRRGVGVILGSWLYIVFAVAVTSRMETSSTDSLMRVALACAVLWPLLYFLFGSSQFIPARMKMGSTIAIILFIFFSLASLIASEDINTSVSYLFMTLGALFIALQFNTNLTASGFETGLKLYAFLMAVSLTWVILMNYIPGERLWVTAAGYNPNSLALVDLSAIVAAMAFRNIPIRCCVAAVPMIATVLTDSRASGTGTIVALIVIAIVRLKVAERSARTLMITLFAIFLVAGVYYREQISVTAADFFQINDEYRGLDTGATGRTAAWRDTWNLFEANPTFGVGFRTHEARLGRESSSHNGYLALLAEIGIAGFMSVMYLIGAGAVFLYKRAANKKGEFAYSILLGLVAGYLVVALFERYLLNVGNPTSLLFMVAITAACQRVRAPAIAQKGEVTERYSILP